MTSPPPPPSYPPYGPPPQYGAPYGPPPSRSSATLVTSLLAALFVVATVVAAIAVHSRDTAVSAAPRVSGVPSGAIASGGVPGAASASSYATPSYSSPTYSPPSYTPAPTPTHQPLDGETVNRVFQVYMNALLNRSLSQLRSATCPRLRKTETGTALDGRYINRWKGHDYRIYNNLDYVILAATVRYINPNTGGNGGSHRYSWYVTRYPDGHYWVCGIL